MNTRTYEIQGKEVGTLAGQTVTFPVFETEADALARAGGVEDVRELVQSAFDVWLQGRVRGWAAAKNKDGSPKNDLAAIQALVDEAKYTRRAEGTGTKREAGPIKQMKSERVQQIAKARELRATKPKQYESLKAAGFFADTLLAEIEAVEEGATATA